MTTTILRTLLLGSMLAGCAAPRPAPAPAPAPASPARFAEEIQRFEAADREQPPRPGGVLFTGSSSIRLWSTLQQDFPGVHLVNRGFGGSELSDVVGYADRVVLPHRPRLVVVYAGDNDLNSGKSPERVLADYRALVERIHRALPRTRVAYIAIKPSVARWHLAPQARAANALVRDFSARDPRLAYIDVWTPMLGPDGTPPRDLFVADGLHMTPKGYAIWREAVAPYLGESWPGR
jgi:lysophospholipase L1-like esterase